MSNLRKILVLICSILPLCLFAKTVSPYTYGLKEAKTGEDVYWILLHTHEVALRNNWIVSYRGISEIVLDIPSNAKPIPLGNITDFRDATFVVRNTKKKDFYLFELIQNIEPIVIPKSMFESYNFRTINNINHKKALLIIEDKNKWIENREGHGYSVYRKDILFLNKGKAINKTISPYNNDFSSHRCWFVKVTNKRKRISNISLQRTLDSTEKTYLVKVANMNNVTLLGIHIYTPEPIKMGGDHAILIENCTNITVKDVTIEGTYSFDNEYGYGIVLNNVWNISFDKINSETAWGVFGCNNVNSVKMTNSTVNRFDAHCYARDFYFCSCSFTQFGLPQSSFWGDVIFDNCTFNHAYAIVSRYDYNAYTPFSITLNNCMFYLNKTIRSVVFHSNVSDDRNLRPELGMKCSPGLSIHNSTIVLHDSLPSIYFFQLGSKASVSSFDYLGSIMIDGLRVVGDCKKLMIYDRPIECKESGNLKLHNILVNEEVLNVSNEFSNNIYGKPEIVVNIQSQN